MNPLTTTPSHCIATGHIGIARKHFSKVFGLSAFIALAAPLPAWSALVLSGNAQLDVSITSINNLTNPGGAVSGLSISGGFTLDPSSGSFPNGNVTETPTYTGGTLPNPVTVGDTVSQTQGYSASIGIGETAAYYLGTGTFDFANTSGNDYSVVMDVSYTLDATATGVTDFQNEYGSTLVSLDIGNSLGSLHYFEALADATVLDHDSVTGTVQLTVNVAASGSEQLTMDTVIDASGLSTTPVPLPPAAWLLFGALSGLAGLRRKRIL